MSLDFPAPVREAIAVAYKIDARAGADAENLITRLWGDVGRVENVAIEWGNGAALASDSIMDLRREIKKVADEDFWEGPAKDSYQAWIELLIGQALTPVQKGIEATGKTLDDAAKTIGDMRTTLVRVCVSFTGAVAGLIGSPTGIGVVALLAFGAWFIGELINFRDSYVNALAGHAEAMREIRDRSIGDEVWTKLDPRYPVPVSKLVVTPPLNKSILGDWDNWEHEDPKVKKP